MPALTVPAAACCPAGWERWAAAFDVVNLVGLLANQRKAGAGTRVADVSRRLEITLAMF